MNARLVLMDGKTEKVFPLTEMSTTIGRAPNNTVQLASVHVSRHHAVIERGANACEIVDMDSTNGTFVNGTKIGRHTTNVLQNGALLRIGEFQLRFEIEPGDDGLRRKTTVHELSARTIQSTVIKGDTTLGPPLPLDETGQIPLTPPAGPNAPAKDPTPEDEAPNP